MIRFRGGWKKSVAPPQICMWLATVATANCGWAGKSLQTSAGPSVRRSTEYIYIHTYDWHSVRSTTYRVRRMEYSIFATKIVADFSDLAS